MTPDPFDPLASAGPAGRRMFEAITAEYELSGADRELLLVAVLVRDQIADLEELVRASGPLIRDANGQPCANPASQQHRLLSITLARLMAAVRVVGDESGASDGPRPQRRAGVRGVYSGLKVAE